MRRLTFMTLVAGLVLLGLVAQAGSYLLALPSPAQAGEPTDATSPFAETGPHAVGVHRLTGDEAPLPITVWYPAHEEDPTGSPLAYAYAINLLGADSALALATYRGESDPGATPDTSQGPYPLVVLSPGFAIRSSSYGWLAEHLASYGFVVVSPQHNESLDPRLLWRSAIERPQDMLTLLAYLDEEVQPESEFPGLIDTETVAVIGHSYGGYTALAAAGARWDTQALETTCETARATDDPLVFLCDALLPRLDDMAALAGLDPGSNGLWPEWADPRVDAAISLAGDAAMFGRAGLAEVTIPVMAMGGTADTDSPFQWTTRPSYEHTSSPRKVQIALEGAQHFIFAGQCQQARRILDLVSTGFCSDPGWDRQRAHDLIQHYTTAFLLSELNDDRAATAALAPTLPRVADVSYRAEGY